MGLYDLNIEEILYETRVKRLNDLTSLLYLISRDELEIFPFYPWAGDTGHQDDLDRVFPLRDDLIETVKALHLLYMLTTPIESDKGKRKKLKLIANTYKNIGYKKQYKIKEERFYRRAEYDIGEIDEGEKINWEKYKQKTWGDWVNTYLLGFELAVYRKDGYEDKNLNWQKGFTERQFNVWQLSLLFGKHWGFKTFVAKRLKISRQMATKDIKAMQNKRDKYIKDVHQFFRDQQWYEKPTTKRGRKIKKWYYNEYLKKKQTKKCGKK